MQLKVGDILKNNRGGILEGTECRVLEVLESLVCVEDDMVGDFYWEKIANLEQKGWQLKKTRWVPKEGDSVWYLSQEGEIRNGFLNNSSLDKWLVLTSQVFQTKEQAEAYRSELIERGK